MDGIVEDCAPARVLVMQDDFFLADEICSALEDAHFEVVGPFEAWSDELARAVEQRPDAAIFDLKMDHEKAKGVLARLETLSIPLVMATGHAQSQNAERLQNCSVVEKPNSVSKIISAIRSALRLKQPKRLSPPRLE